jgi:glycosyltransferase involved in cell wall biosynthesis
MKVLHVGWGFQPFRGGGLIEYAEDLMEAQAGKGYEVGYFCTGRFSIITNTPKLKKWKSDKGYTVFEVWNPPIIGGFDFGIKNPAADVYETATEKLFMEAVKAFAPDIVHIQEVLGVPTSVFPKLRDLNIKTIFTVEDYFYLCPTLKLVLPDMAACRIKGPELGKQCAVCCNNAPRHNLSYKLHMMYPKLLNSTWVKSIKKVKKKLLKTKPQAPPALPLNLDERLVADFNLRREFNLQAIKTLDLVIAMSNKVASIFNYYEPLDNMITLNLTLKHIDTIKGKLFDDKAAVINFAVINALNTPLKGRHLVLRLFEMINQNSWKHKLRFKIMGYVNDEDALLLKQYSFIDIAGKFNATKLDSIFDDLGIHVGIVPSVWEEAYGYVGIEFLAKGIPVIGNDMGGIPDYTTPETGWLNKTCDAAGLFNIIQDIIHQPEKIYAINKNLVNNREKYIKNMDTHFNEMDELYKGLFKNNQTINTLP